MTTTEQNLTDQLQEVGDLISLYQDFWEINQEPTIPLQDVQHLLAEAAEIVVQLKTLKNQDSSHTVIAANAHEYLWNLEALPPPQDFVRGLIHASLQLGDGTYIDDLNSEAVDLLISHVIETNLAHTNSTLFKLQAEQISEQIKSRWAAVTKSLPNVLNGNAEIWTSSLVSDLAQLQNFVDLVQKQIDCFEARKSFKEHDQLSLSSRCKQEGQKPKQTTGPNFLQMSLDEETKSGILKVENLQREAANLGSEISNLSNAINSDIKNVSTLALKPKESLEHIAEMKKKAAIYFDSLSKNLDSLDLISNEKLRPLRKDSINNVQGLLDSVEQMQSQLLKLEKEMNAALAKEQKAKTEMGSAEASWRQLRLDVDLQTHERRDCYIITGNIPNMDEKDITVGLDNDKLVVGGFRGPTNAELEVMQRLLRVRTLGLQLSFKDQTMELLRMGQGRFGTFKQSFILPQNVITKDIEASYLHGTLRLRIPKRVQQQQPPQQPPCGTPISLFEPHSQFGGLGGSRFTRVSREPRLYSVGYPYSLFASRRG